MTKVLTITADTETWSQEDQRYAIEQKWKWKCWAADNKYKRTGVHPGYPRPPPWVVAGNTRQDVVCECGETVNRAIRSINRARKAGRKIMCSECLKKNKVKVKNVME